MRVVGFRVIKNPICDKKACEIFLEIILDDDYFFADLVVFAEELDFLLDPNSFLQ